MNPMGIGIVYLRGPNIRMISCQSAENLEGHMSLTEMTYVVT